MYKSVNRIHPVGGLGAGKRQSVLASGGLRDSRYFTLPGRNRRTACCSPHPSQWSGGPGPIHLQHRCQHRNRFARRHLQLKLLDLFVITYRFEPTHFWIPVCWIRPLQTPKKSKVIWKNISTRLFISCRKTFRAYSDCAANWIAFSPRCGVRLSTSAWEGTPLAPELA